MPPRIRPSDVFIKEDIRGILAALALTAQTHDNGEFTRGYCAALAAVAVALNMEPPPDDGRPVTFRY